MPEFHLHLFLLFPSPFSRTYVCLSCAFLDHRLTPSHISHFLRFVPSTTLMTTTIPASMGTGTRCPRPPASVGPASQPSAIITSWRVPHDSYSCPVSWSLSCAWICQPTMLPRAPVPCRSCLFYPTLQGCLLAAVSLSNKRVLHGSFIRMLPPAPSPPNFLLYEFPFADNVRSL
ncbi:hypothetical protein IWZ03DRAFT_134796 [Phyllosticta citriasiana]|uniref:Uncharacterized protein n=1 Tax=Phyllosticta citriasiana TaxID=595635 RepID=A0ABR1KRZ8_9PEZI